MKRDGDNGKRETALYSYALRAKAWRACHFCLRPALFNANFNHLINKFRSIE